MGFGVRSAELAGSSDGIDCCSRLTKLGGKSIDSTLSAPTAVLAVSPNGRIEGELTSSSWLTVRTGKVSCRNTAFT